MWIKETLLILALGLASWAVFGAEVEGEEFQREKSELVRLYPRVLKPLREGYLTSADFAKIARIYRDRGENIPQNVFEVVLQARLRTVPQSIARKVWDIYKIKYYITDVPLWNIRKPLYFEVQQGKVAGGGFLSLLAKPHIEVILPGQYHATELAYAILDHEFEHLITAAYFDYWSNRGILRVSFGDMQEYFQNYALPSYLNEEGAMLSEWHYMLYVPQSRRQRLADQVLADSEIPANLRELLLALLNMENRDSQEYLNAQRAGVRIAYSTHGNEKLCRGKVELIGALARASSARKSCRVPLQNSKRK